ncbi:nucleotidyltransferase domain-containing protein [Heliobacterium chlorum]|uniref:Nucleotidyltransferase domain-containing protein n=1 Tax=Heliobacterium chlorum TaxID=2698 RepID=A0ABR7T097_HELCL|nr:nucleotidyltransferase domain-containing protein [Heliobacterium chlorum]MBC9784111.1 nucleotidyltransferase domain-containing protein [Heliobacterium chlorum]
MTPLGVNKQLLGNIVSTISNYKEIEKALIFGSRASGDYKNYSDINIALFLKDDIPTQLFFDLDELNCIYKIDLVNFNKSCNEDFKGNILKQGIEMYNKQVLPVT